MKDSCTLRTYGTVFPTRNSVDASSAADAALDDSQFTVLSSVGHVNIANG